MQLVVEVFKHFIKRVLLTNTKDVLIERIEPSFLFYCSILVVNSCFW